MQDDTTNFRTSGRDFENATLRAKALTVKQATHVGLESCVFLRAGRRGVLAVSDSCPPFSARDAGRDIHRRFCNQRACSKRGTVDYASCYNPCPFCMCPSSDRDTRLSYLRGCCRWIAAWGSGSDHDPWQMEAVHVVVNTCLPWGTNLSRTMFCKHLSGKMELYCCWSFLRLCPQRRVIDPCG